MEEAIQITNSHSGSATLAVAHSIEKHRVAAVVMVLAILPVVLPYPALAINILIFGLFATGFNLLFGYTGLLSLGHAALFGAGAYGCGIAVAALGLPWFVAIAAGIALAIFVAAVIGRLSIKNQGVYFSNVNLALVAWLYFNLL